jgi:hypothetical protein
MVTENETGLFQCDQETKHQSMQWKTPASLRPRNTQVSKIQNMMLVALRLE